MKAYSLITIFICVCTYTTIDIRPELKKNILNFGYWIHFKFEGMLFYSIDRFCVVTAFTLLSMDDIKISPITFDMDHSYLTVQLDRRIYAIKHIPNKNFFVQI